MSAQTPRERARDDETWFTATGIGSTIEAAKANTLQIIDAVVPDETHVIIYLAWGEAHPTESYDNSADDVPISRFVRTWEISARVRYDRKK